jgi:predicted PurR-regulated permease PerM
MKLDIQLFADGKVVIQTKLDTSGFEEGLDDMENGSMLSKFIGVIKEKLSNIGTAMSDAIKKAGKGIKGLGKAIKEVSKIALQSIAKFTLGAIKLGAILLTALPIVALLGLGFLAVMEAIKKVSNENQTIKNDIKYIWFSIKTAIQPAIDAIANGLVKIINFLIQIVKYAMAFANALAGRNLFEKATPKAFAKSMKDAEKSSKGVAKNAKEIKKQLAGFDEMNVLQDNTASGGGASATPTDFGTSFDASKLDIELPKWLQWIVDNKQFVVDGLLGIATGLTAVKLGLSALQGVGLGLITFGLTELIRDITNPKTDGLEKAFKILGDIAIILGGILMFFNPLYGIVVALIGFVLKYFPEISNWVSNLEDKIANWFINLKEKAREFGHNLGVKVGEFIVKHKDKILVFINWIKKVVKGVGNAIIAVLNGIITGLNIILAPLRTIIWGFGKISGKNWKLSDIAIPHIKPLAKGGIINQPGRGIAVGGERGAEGVIPLTDSQQMELLGEAIGKYITINANITNTMNGRIISRELQKINNENSFAMNR